MYLNLMYKNLVLKRQQTVLKIFLIVDILILQYYILVLVVLILKFTSSSKVHLIAT